MGRLTKSNPVWIDDEFWVSAEEPDEEEIDAVYLKLKDYEDAEEQGLLVRLDMPRKPIVWGDDEHDACLCPDCSEDLMGIPYGERMVLQCPTCGQYVDTTKAITREEAEKALKGANR